MGQDRWMTYTYEAHVRNNFYPTLPLTLSSYALRCGASIYNESLVAINRVRVLLYLKEGCSNIILLWNLSRLLPLKMLFTVCVALLTAVSTSAATTPALPVVDLGYERYRAFSYDVNYPSSIMRNFYSILLLVLSLS